MSPLNKIYLFCYQNQHFVLFSVKIGIFFMLFHRVSYKDFEDFLHWKSIENVYFQIRKSIENALPLISQWTVGMRSPFWVL